jgi:hypothetical protein
MLTETEEEQLKAVHARYMSALSQGDFSAVAEQFTFPAVLKGFLEDITVVTDARSLASAYEHLIAAAPKAARTDVKTLQPAYLRPGVFSLTMHYEQFDADDVSIHSGSAVYLLKGISDELKIFGVI